MFVCFHMTHVSSQALTEPGIWDDIAIGAIIGSSYWSVPRFINDQVRNKFSSAVFIWVKEESGAHTVELLPCRECDVTVLQCTTVSKHASVGERSWEAWRHIPLIDWTNQCLIPVPSLCHGLNWFLNLDQHPQLWDAACCGFVRVSCYLKAAQNKTR